MLLGETKIGKPIELNIRRDGYNYRVVSKIEDASEHQVCISLIASATRIFQFLDTDEVSIIYRNEDRMWKWTDVKGDIVEIDGETFHSLTSEKPGEVYNRRNAYRVSVNERMELQYKIIEPRPYVEMEECYRLEGCQAVLRDISEVGVGFFSNELLNLETEITFELQTKVGNIKCEGTIIRFFESRHGNYKYYYGCRLIETSRTLTKYIYEMQRLELQKAKNRIIRR